MGIFLGILGAVLGIAGLGCWVTILMDAFDDELWKGLLCLFVPIYVLYYAIVEFDADNKWLILLGYVLAQPAGLFCLMFAFHK